MTFSLPKFLSKKAPEPVVVNNRQGTPWKHLLARSYDEETGLFLCHTESGEARLGAIFESPPMLGADDGTMERFRTALSNPLPPGSFVQIGLLSIPDILNQTNAYLFNKTVASGVLGELAMRRTKLVRDASESALPQMNGVLLTTQRVIVSVTIPCSASPTGFEIKAAEDAAGKLRDGLITAGLSLRQMNDAEYLSLLRRFFDLHGGKNTNIEEFSPLREQVFSPGNSVDFEKSEIVFNDGEYAARMLSVKFFPQKTNIGIMNMLIGDPRGSANQVSDPFWLSATIHYPDREKKGGEIRRKYAFITNQAIGGMANIIPVLGYKKRGLDILVHDMDGNGALLCEINFAFTLFSKDRTRLNGLSAAVCAWAGSFGLELREDRRILKPLFYSVLPMNTSVNGIGNLYRFNTMTMNQAIRFLPILGDWEGSGSGASSLFMSRRGRPVLFDPYDSDTNYNGVIFAESGSGKSVVAQQFCVDMLGQGAKVWVVDQGRSYEKICSVLGGQFIEFSDESNICLNPFTHVKDINEDMEILKNIFAKMAAPEAGLDDFQMSVLEEAIKSVWETYVNNASITEVAEWCLNYPSAPGDTRRQDIGQQLYQFTRNGSYGRWFDGRSNVDFTKDFVVLELQELSAKKVLQQVVLMLLFDRIGNEMYFTTGRKKMLLVDESWSLIDDPIVGKVLTAGFRKVRKHDGSAWVVTQSMGDLYNSANGQVILDTCAWQIILKQRSESVDKAASSGHLNLDSYAQGLLKTVGTVPGKYSEMMIRRSAGNWGVVRFVTDRFSQILFSTKGWEREELLDALKRGENIIPMINRFVEEGR